MILKYRQREHGGSNLRPISYAICLDWTPCNYGNKKPWFICPAHGCERRAAILYSADRFACRKCHRLLYQSQLDSVSFRATHKSQAIRRRLGGSCNLTEPFPAKPRGMHWKTYSPLYKQSEAADQTWVSGMSAWLASRGKLRIVKKKERA